MDEWQEWRRKQEELEQERKRKQEEIEKRARILREVHQPPTCEQIPAQPVVPVGPVTIEQKVAALNDEVAKIQKKIHYILGLLNVTEYE